MILQLFRIGLKHIFLLFLLLIRTLCPIFYWVRMIYILARLGVLSWLQEELMALLVYEHIQDEAGLNILLLIELLDALV
jgi:hypothetical protein